MKTYIYIIGLAMAFTVASCNDEVFVERPKDTPPSTEEPDDPDTPEMTDSLMLKSFRYLENTLELGENESVYEVTTTIKNFTDSRDIQLSYDRYNNAIVRIYNNTYYVTPWAKSGQPEVEVPGLDADGVPGFYGTKIPFAFGRTIIPGQYKQGEIIHFDLPKNHQVTATAYVTRKAVRAKADIEYNSIEYRNSIMDGWVEVQVEIPVDITIEWSEVTPAEL